MSPRCVRRPHVPRRSRPSRPSQGTPSRHVHLDPHEPQRGRPSRPRTSVFADATIAAPPSTAARPTITITASSATTIGRRGTAVSLTLTPPPAQRPAAWPSRHDGTVMPASSWPVPGCRAPGDRRPRGSRDGDASCHEASRARDADVALAAGRLGNSHGLRIGLDYRGSSRLAGAVLGRLDVKHPRHRGEGERQDHHHARETERELDGGGAPLSAHGSAAARAGTASDLATVAPFRPPPMAGSCR